MPIPIQCPCGEKLRVRDELAGSLFRCPGCGRNHDVPTPIFVTPEPAPIPVAVPTPGVEETTRALPLSSSAKFAIFVGASVAVALIAALTLYVVLRDPRPEEERPRGEPGPRSFSLGQTNRNNLKQIGIAMQNYHDAYGCFPPAAGSPQPGAPPVSWRVLLLPYLDANDVYQAWNMTEPWDGPNNRKLWGHMPKCYQLPPRPGDGTKTYYQVFVGPDTIFPPDRAVGMVEITDGTSNTILVAEGPEPVLWCEPVDIPFQASLDGYDPKKVGGYFGKVVNVLLADGSVRSVSWDLSPKMFQNAITRADGQVVNLDD